MTIGAINGGTTYNVIPPRVALKGTVRTFCDATREAMEARVRRIAEHTCAAGNATCSLTWMPSYPVTENDPAEAAFVRETLACELGAERVMEIPPIMGSEDFSYFARAVPACFMFLGAGDAAHAFPNHHPRSTSTRVRWRRDRLARRGRARVARALTAARSVRRAPAKTTKGATRAPFVSSRCRGGQAAVCVCVCASLASVSSRAKAAASWTARSARAFRFTATPDFFRPDISFE